MDMETELASLDVHVEWDAENVLDGLTTPSPSNSPLLPLHDAIAHTPEQLQQDIESFTAETLHDQNNEEPAIELASAPIPVQDSLGPVAAATHMARTTEPPSGHYDEANSVNPVAPPPVVDPNPLPQMLPDSSVPLPNETQSNYPSPPVAGLMSGEAASSNNQDQDIIQTSGLNQFPRQPNENSHGFHDLGMPNEHNTSNPLSVPNVIGNDHFSGVNLRSPSYPASFQPNPAEVGAMIATEARNGQFVTHQRPAFSPLKNQIISPLSSWNFRLRHNPFAVTNAHDSQCSPTYMQYDSSASYRSHQQITSLLHQVSHSSETQKVFDLQSQHPMQPATHPTFPSYPPFHDNQNNDCYHSQAIIPNVDGQQGVDPVQLSGSPRVSDQGNEYNQLLNTPNLERTNPTLHGSTALSSRLTSSQSLSSRILGLSGTRTTEGTSFRDSSEISGLSSLTRPERASGIQLQQVTSVCANRVTILRDKGKLPESSSRAQPSEGIFKIPNQNATPAVASSPSTPPHQNRSLTVQNRREAWIDDLEKRLAGREQGHHAPPRRGRPPKRVDLGDSSSSSKRPKKVSSGTERGRSRTARNVTPEIEKEDQNANATIPSPAPNPRPMLNAIYDPSFERLGMFIDPHLRLFKPPPEK